MEDPTLLWDRTEADSARNAIGSTLAVYLLRIVSFKVTLVAWIWIAMKTNDRVTHLIRYTGEIFHIG